MSTQPLAVGLSTGLFVPGRAGPDQLGALFARMALLSNDFFSCLRRHCWLKRLPCLLFTVYCVLRIYLQVFAELLYRSPPALPEHHTRVMLSKLCSAWALVGAVGAVGLAHASPFIPKTDAEVVERLPGRASDPSARRLDALRKQLAARPDDSALRIELARRYFDLAMAQGDPRYIGYASAALAPLAKAAPDHPGYPMALGLIEQFSHDFDSALVNLAKAARLSPQSPEPLLWRTAIFMVQARYPEALAECQRLVPLVAATAPLLGTGCTAYVQATTGQLAPAFQTLSTQVDAQRAELSRSAPELLLWQDTRLAEMATRLGRFDRAEAYFTAGLKLGLTDQFLLGAYADFLLTRQRPAEVLSLLAQWERSDILLLRLALAGKGSADKRAAGWASQLRERFVAAAQRGDRLHEQEAARFELDIEGNATKALSLASANYSVQKEPRDAEILLRTALAAHQPKAAQPALDWMKSSGYEDPPMQALVSELTAQGATR